MNNQIPVTENRFSRLRRLVLTCAVIALTATVVDAGEKVAENFDFQPGQTLTLDFMHGGSIRIEGWDRSEVQIGYKDDNHDLDRYDIQFESSIDGLSVKASLLEGFHNSSIEFDFKVPRELIVEIDSAGGHIMLEDLVGDFSGHTGGGNLLIKDVQGDVNLRTGGGRILVEDSIVDGKVQTGGGKVLVQNVKGDFDATSGGGEVKFLNFTSVSGHAMSPNNRTLEDASSGTVLISNAGGGIKVDAAPEGADVSTGGGKIRVKNASRFVAAKTGGGDIELGLTEGWVNASTGAGDVAITIGYNTEGEGDIEVFTGNGDVTLVLPADFSMDLMVELGVTNNTNKRYGLISDFDIDSETDADWDYSRGTPRKFTRGSAILNGGNHQIRIRSTNGNVTIKKG